MKFTRNPEIAHALTVSFILSAAAAVFAFSRDRGCGIAVIVLVILLNLIYFYASHFRYMKIKKLSDLLDNVLYNSEYSIIDDCGEGELAVLQSEIAKLVGTMREQQSLLLKEKIFLSDSIADISHQLKTPLTSINLLVSMLSAQGLDENRRLELCRSLSRQLSGVDWLVASLLKMSKLDAGTAGIMPASTEMSELVERSVQPLLIPLELKQIEFSFCGGGGCVCDVSWTSEALRNILKNCMEHTPSGGKITVTASETPLFSELIITDNGSGIDSDDLPHIFERFYKGKNSDAGSVGIGLALAKTIINAQNGTVKAKNNNGAEFTIHFYKSDI